MNQKSNLISQLPQDLLQAWETHMQCEFETKDVDGTMATMVDPVNQPEICEDAHINNAATMMGGVGLSAIRNFYTNYFIHQLPKDTQTDLISRTIGSDQIVDELIFKFTHSQTMDWILPGVSPTYKYVEVALVVIIKFHEGKVLHEHIYWDQASVLVQIGLINPKNLPVVGIEGAQKMRDPKAHASNLLVLKN